MEDTLHRLFRYKAWANDELLKKLTELGAGSAVTQLSIQALSHSYIVDRIFAAHLRREPHDYTATNPGEQPPLEQLAADIRRSDREYIDYVATLDRRQLSERIDFVFTDGAPGRMTRAEMLLHVITHGVGHRGQISAVMLLNGLPALKDGFTTYLHAAEASGVVAPEWRDETSACLRLCAGRNRRIKSPIQHISCDWPWRFDGAESAQ